MQFTVRADRAPDMPRITAALADLDASALVDFDLVSSTLRVSTQLRADALVRALADAGMTVEPAQLARVASECCGGCGG